MAVFGLDFHLQNGNTPGAGYELVVFARGREIVRRSLKHRMDLRTCATSGLVLGTGISFYCAIDPSSGETLWSRKKWIGLPDRAGEILYGLSHDGVLFASRLKSYPTRRAGAAR